MKNKLTQGGQLFINGELIGDLTEIEVETAHQPGKSVLLDTLIVKVSMPKKEEKPPLGLTPKWVHDEKRLYEIIKAAARYSEAGVPVPFEWMEELESLISPVLNKIREIYPTTKEEA